MIGELYAKLRSLSSALLQETKLEKATGEVRDRLEALAKANTGSAASAAAAPPLGTGVREFRSTHDPDQVYRVTFGRAGHLECTCDGFRRRGNCNHEVLPEIRTVKEATM